MRKEIRERLRISDGGLLIEGSIFLKREILYVKNCKFIFSANGTHNLMKLKFEVKDGKDVAWVG